MLSHFSRVQLCDPMGYRPPGSSVHGILQARILEWVAMTSSRGSSQPRDQTCVSLHLLLWQAGSLPLAPPGKPTIFKQIQIYKEQHYSHFFFLIDFFSAYLCLIYFFLRKLSIKDFFVGFQVSVTFEPQKMAKKQVMERNSPPS